MSELKLQIELINELFNGKADQVDANQSASGLLVMMRLRQWQLENAQTLSDAFRRLAEIHDEPAYRSQEQRLNTLSKVWKIPHLFMFYASRIIQQNGDLREEIECIFRALVGSLSIILDDVIE